MLFRFKEIDKSGCFVRYECEYCNYRICVEIKEHIANNKEWLKEHLLWEVYRHIAVELDD